MSTNLVPGYLFECLTCDLKREVETKQEAQDLCRKHSAETTITAGHATSYKAVYLKPGQVFSVFAKPNLEQASQPAPFGASPKTHFTEHEYVKWPERASAGEPAAQQVCNATDKAHAIVRMWLEMEGGTEVEQRDRLVEDIRDAILAARATAATASTPAGEPQTVGFGELIPAIVNGEPGRVAFFSDEAAAAHGLKLNRDVIGGECSKCGHVHMSIVCSCGCDISDKLLKVTPPAPPATERGVPVMRDEQIKHMVNRFLMWRLPENFNPDGGISFKRDFNENTPHPMKHEPVGTNLFDATQAEEMVRYMVNGLSLAAAAQPPERGSERS